MENCKLQQEHKPRLANKILEPEQRPNKTRQRHRPNMRF